VQPVVATPGEPRRGPAAAVRRRRHPACCRPPRRPAADEADDGIGQPDLVTGEGTEPVIKLVDTLLTDALASRASDLHLEPEADGLRVRLRIDGLLRERGHIPPQRSDQVVSRLKVVAGLDITERRLPQDGRIQARSTGRLVDLRMATMPTLRGESLLVRLLPTGSARDAPGRGGARRAGPPHGSSRRCSAPRAWCWSPAPRGPARRRPSTRAARGARRAAQGAHPRGPGRVRPARHPPDPGRAGSGSPSSAACATSSATTPTWCWWARSATARPPAWRSRPRSPATSCWPRCTPTTRPPRSPAW
jgi:hypothetical protein